MAKSTPSEPPHVTPDEKTQPERHVIPRNIFQRINEVRKLAAYVVKDQPVNKGQFKVVTHDQVTALLRPALIEHGIVVQVSEVSSAVVLTGMKAATGAEYVRFEGNYKIEFVNIDDPKDRTEMVLTAHAVDPGDKAPGKAISYAKKYAELKLFDIESGESDESRYGDFDDPEPEASAGKADSASMMPKEKRSAPAAGAEDSAVAEAGEVAFITTKLKLLKTVAPSQVLQESGAAVGWDEKTTALTGTLTKADFASIKAAIKGKS